MIPALPLSSQHLPSNGPGQSPGQSHGKQADWQKNLRDAVRDPAELLALLELSTDWLPAARAAAAQFPLRVPRGFVARMEMANPHDPLLRQVLPLGDELVATAGYKTDPVGDMASQLTPGLLQKYAGRVLLVTTGACAVHCRYCFRRHFPYSDENPRRGQWQTALEAIRADKTITEVILSGGDPLSLSDDHLQHLVGELNAIPHLTRLRIHTRQPVVLPERVNDRLIAWLSDSRLQKVVVIHSNHAQEIDSKVAAAIQRLRTVPCTVLNQAVLLRGVNDSVSALADLGETLFQAGVMPYYLHLLDKVEGAAHFDVPKAQAQHLMRGLRARLPGYLVPQLAQEVAGDDSKRLIAY